MLYRFLMLSVLVFTCQNLLAEDYYYDDDGCYEYVESEPCEPFYIPCYAADDCAPSCEPCCWNIFLNADYLFWQARSDQLAYAFTRTILPSTLPESKIQRVDPDFSSGVRLGLGTLLPCFDCWYLSAEWTYYHSKSTDTANKIGNTIPLYIDPQGGPSADLAEAEYRLELNIADLSIEKTFCPLRRLTLSPSIGVRGIWLDQDLDANFTGGNLGAGIFSKNSINLKGGGLRTGLSTKWDICYGFSLLAWSNFDVLWTYLDVSQRSIANSDGTTRDATKDALYTVIPVFEWFLGARWERKVCCTNVSARVGWEEQYFLNAVQFNMLTENTTAPSPIAHQTGGLGLGGLTAGLSIGF